MRPTALGEKAQKILDIIEAHPGIKQFEIRRLCGYEATTTRHVLTRLAMLGKIQAIADDFTWRYRAIDEDSLMEE